MKIATDLKAPKMKPRVAILLTASEVDQLERLAADDERSKTSMARIIYHKGLKQHLQDSNSVK